MFISRFKVSFQYNLGMDKPRMVLRLFYDGMGKVVFSANQARLNFKLRLFDQRKDRFALCFFEFFGDLKAMATKEEIYAKVSATLIEALNVEEDEVKPTSTLQGDLGAESIDYLDIVFRLEREFGIKIPRNELFPEAVLQGDPDIVQNGKVTPKGIEELKEKMPFADLTEFAKNPEVNNFSDLFTVALIARYIEGKLAAGKN